MNIPVFEEKSLLYDWLIQNKGALLAQKKAAIKYADAVSFAVPLVNEKGDTVKAEAVPATANKIKVRSIINTTKLLDSHGDVHIDQLWNKSLKETKEHYLVNQHNFSFEGIISDDVKAFAKQMTWAELGYDYEGTTQALVFDSVISKDESPQMFDRYRQGRVKQHSVGMRYVKMDLAINDDRYEKEHSVWEKYFPNIANKEDAVELGYFWAVTEAKVIEGSAVVRGSNFATPTYSVDEKAEPPKGTPDEPVRPLKLDVESLLVHYKI